MSHVVFPGLGLDLLMKRAAFSIFNKDIYWYGIIIAVGFALAVLYAMLKAKDFGLTGDQVVDYLIWGTVFAIIGARLYYVIFSFDKYASDPLSIFYIWEGGIAIYGAVIGAFATGLVISRIKKLNPYKIYDLAAIGFLIGQIIGRWGNFVNAEAYGKAFASQNVADLPFWAMGVYTNGALTYVHPIFLYESLWNLVGLLIIFLLIKPHISWCSMSAGTDWAGSSRKASVVTTPCISSIRISACPRCSACFFSSRPSRSLSGSSRIRKRRDRSACRK